MNIGETVEHALLRETKEEISLDVKIKELLSIYSESSRYKLFLTVSAAYICKELENQLELMMIKKLVLQDLQLEKLVFDHGDR